MGCLEREGERGYCGVGLREGEREDRWMGLREGERGYVSG